MAVLVVGASGILAPAAATLLGRGEAVVGVARRHRVPAGVEPLLLDATDAAAVGDAIRERELSAAIVYEPAVTDASLAVLRSHVPRVVLVRTTAAVDPALGEPARPPADTLQLGWTAFRNGTRWHCPEEVSAAAVDVLDDGAGRTLGSIRPWSARP